MDFLQSTIEHATSLVTALIGLAVACGSLWQTLANKRRIRVNRQEISDHQHAISCRMDAIERREGEERRSGDDRRGGGDRRSTGRRVDDRPGPADA